MNIRRYKIGEEETLWRLCRDTTLRVNARDYGMELAEKWAPSQIDVGKWAERMRTKNPFVADQDGFILGFAELTGEGYISGFYCHHMWQRQGVGSALYQAIEVDASRLGVDFLQVEASTSAKGFFLSMGFDVVEEKENLTYGTPFKSYLMRKGFL